MPIYDYHCENFELQFKYLYQDDTRVRSPKCDSKQAQRQLSVIAPPAISSNQNCGTLMLSGGRQLPQCGTGGGGGF